MTRLRALPPGRHTVPNNQEGRGGAGKGGEKWETERRSRRWDLSSRECSGLGRRLCGNFKLSAKKGGGGKGRKGKQGGEGQDFFVK